MKTWMRRRGDRVTITTGKYAGHTGTIDSNVYQKSVDYPGEFSNVQQIMPDSEKLMTGGNKLGCSEAAEAGEVPLPPQLVWWVGVWSNCF